MPQKLLNTKDTKCTKDSFDLRLYTFVSVVSFVVKMVSFYPISRRRVMKMPFTGILIRVGVGADHFIEGDARL